MPVSGSSYIYCHASLGEAFAWGLAWILIFDYGLAEALIAAGFAGYLASFLADLDVSLPAALITPMLEATPRGGGFELAMNPSVNLVAAISVMIAAPLLTRGVHTSSTVNNILVAIKVSVLAAFVVVGARAISPGNWTPFIPANEGGFAFGWEGVVRAASILFFAYLGFETISTATSETRNPQHDMPIGILGALAACTVIYIAVALVLTGVVPFRELATPDPIAVALDNMGWPSLALIVKGGTVLGLGTVLLVNALAYASPWRGTGSCRRLSAAFTASIRRRPSAFSCWALCQPSAPLFCRSPFSATSSASAPVLLSPS